MSGDQLVAAMVDILNKRTNALQELHDVYLTYFRTIHDAAHSLGSLVSRAALDELVLTTGYQTPQRAPLGRPRADLCITEEVLYDVGQSSTAVPR